MNELGVKLRDERVRQGWGSGEFASSAKLDAKTLRDIEEDTAPKKEPFQAEQ